MIERSKLDLWYDNKKPAFDLSSSGICPEEKHKDTFYKAFYKSSAFDLCKNYGDSCGYGDLISTLCQKYNCSSNNILITNGASEALYIVLRAFTNQNCDIVYQRPYYQNLDSLIFENGNHPIHYNLNPVDNFNFNFETLKECITINTNLLILNFPNNPTGSIIQNEDSDNIINLASMNNFLVLFDEVSADINYKQSYDCKKIKPAKSLNNAIYISSMSKAFGFPGLRVGWIVSNKQFIEQCQSIKEIISVSSVLLSQYISNELLMQQDSILIKNISQIKNNLQYLQTKFDEYRDYFSLIVPHGGACCFVKILSNIDVDRFCIDLYTLKGVLVTPGSIFGYKNYIRIGLGTESEKFKIAIEILLNFISSYCK